MPSPPEIAGAAVVELASGDLGKLIVIIPSQRLVVVRLGDSVDQAGDIRGVARLVKQVIAAVQP